MTFILYDYVNARRANEIQLWIDKLQVVERAKLNERLDKLIHLGDDLYPQILCGTTVPGIQKLRVHGKVQLRPMLCKGPILINREYTLLAGAKEVGSKLLPKGVELDAKSRKEEVMRDHENRRCRNAINSKAAG